MVEGFDPTETARKFMNDSQVGWIDPDGNVYPVPLFQHASFFRHHWDAIPAVASFWSKIEEEALRRHCLAWREENPEVQWHEYYEPEYDPAYDDERGDMMELIMKAVYTSGWGRVGSFHSGKFELQCHSEHEGSLTRKARAFAELIGRELHVRTCDFEWVNTQGYLSEIFEPELTQTPR